MPAGTPIEAPSAAPSTAPLPRLPTPFPDTAKNKNNLNRNDLARQIKRINLRFTVICYSG